MNQLSLFGLVWPMFCEMLLLMSLGFVNVYILSMYSNAAAAAVEATNQIMFNVFLLFVIISSGTSILVSQNIGANKRLEIERICAVSLATNLLSGLAASFLVAWRADWLLHFMGISPDLFDLSYTYLSIIGAFFFFEAIILSSDAILKSYGYTKQCLLITICMNIVNVTGASLFGLGLFGLPALGVQGVAIATVVSKSVAAGCLLTFLFTRIVPPAIIKHLLDFPVKELKKLFRVGFPSAMENMSYSLSQTVLMSLIIVNLGSDSYVARTYVWAICKFALLFALAIGQANLIMIGRLIGQGNYEEAEKQGMRNFNIAFIVSCITGGCLFLFGKTFMGIFTTDANLIAMGATVLAIDGFLEPGRTFNLVFINGLKGAGDVVFPVIVAIFSMWLINIGLGYYAGIILGFGLPGIWTAMVLDEWLRGFCMLYRWKSKAWMKKSFVAS